MTQLTSLNTCVLHHGYIYRISVYFSSRYNVDYIYRISVYFSSRYNSEYQTKNYIYCIYDTVITSLNACVLRHGYIYRISVCSVAGYNSEKNDKKLLCICDPVNVSKYMCITPWFYTQNFCMFQFQV